MPGTVSSPHHRPFRLSSSISGRERTALDEQPCAQLREPARDDDVVMYVSGERATVQGRSMLANTSARGARARLVRRRHQASPIARQTAFAHSTIMELDKQTWKTTDLSSEHPDPHRHFAHGPDRPPNQPIPQRRPSVGVAHQKPVRSTRAHLLRAFGTGTRRRRKRAWWVEPRERCYCVSTSPATLRGRDEVRRNAVTSDEDLADHRQQGS